MQWLVPNRQRGIALKNEGTVHWCIHVTPGACVTTQIAKFMGLSWGPPLVLLATDGPYVATMNLAMRVRLTVFSWNSPSVDESDRHVMYQPVAYPYKLTWYTSSIVLNVVFGFENDCKLCKKEAIYYFVVFKQRFRPDIRDNCAFHAA